MPEGAAIGALDRVRRSLAHRGRKGLDAADRGARRATARLRARPTFLVLGAQKAGTTSLHHYLAQHPAVLTARLKEVEYFTKYHARGDGWYRAQFPLASRARSIRRELGVWPAVGEATAACLFDPRSPGRVHAFDPRMRLVVVLRDPVERAYSHFQMELRWNREHGSFEEALAREEAEWPAVLDRLLHDPSYQPADGLARTYVARGRYAEQLERWLALFPREQLHFLTSDELLEDPGRALSGVTAFLGIPEHRPSSYPLRGKQEYAPMAPETRERLRRELAGDDERLAALLGRELPWRSAARDTAAAAEGSAG